MASAGEEYNVLRGAACECTAPADPLQVRLASMSSINSIGRQLLNHAEGFTKRPHACKQRPACMQSGTAGSSNRSSSITHTAPCSACHPLALAA
jgi:hypothetical protein